MTAFTERELLPRFSAGRGGAPRHPLRYTMPDGRPKGLMPDVLALEPDGQSVVWFEIDRSARGAQRLDDLAGLVGRLGSSVDLGNGTRGVLRRVVVWCKTPGILRRNRTHLTGRMPTRRGPVPRLRVGIAEEPALRDRGNDVYDMRKDLDVTLPNGWVQRQTLVVGQLHLQLLPTHLPGYSYRHGRARGWFDDGGGRRQLSWPAGDNHLGRTRRGTPARDRAALPRPAAARDPNAAARLRPFRRPAWRGAHPARAGCDESSPELRASRHSAARAILPARPPRTARSSASPDPPRAGSGRCGRHPAAPPSGKAAAAAHSPAGPAPAWCGADRNRTACRCLPARRACARAPCAPRWRLHSPIRTSPGRGCGAAWPSPRLPDTACSSRARPFEQVRPAPPHAAGSQRLEATHLQLPVGSCV